MAERCTFYITSQDDARGIKLGRLRIADVNSHRCPRNLPKGQRELAQPNGSAPCPLFDQEACARAYTEQYRCPKRTADRQDAWDRDLSIEDEYDIE